MRPIQALLRKNPGGGGGGGGSSFVSPFGMNLIDHFRSYGDAVYTDLRHGDDDTYVSATLGQTRVPDANRDANGYVISVPADATGPTIYRNIRYPLGTGNTAFTWTGTFDALNLAGLGCSISGVGANSATLGFTETVSSTPGRNANAQLQYQINVANPPKNWQMIPSGRSASDRFNAESETALSTYLGGGAIRPIKHFMHVEGGQAVTSRNTRNSAVYWNNDGTPFEDELDRCANHSAPLWWNIGLKEADAVIQAKADLLQIWLAANGSRRAFLESGNESWNSGLYYENAVTLRGLAAVNHTDGGSTGAAISSITHSGATATVTTSTAHGLSNGASITIHGALPRQYNVYPATISGVTSNTLQYTCFEGAPATNATSVGALYINQSDILGGQIKEHARRSNYVMDLVFARLSAPQQAQVKRCLGSQNAGPSSIGLTAMNFSDTPSHHDALAIAAYFGTNGSDPTYPPDGMSRGSPAPYTSADFNNFRDFIKTDVDAVLALVTTNIANAASKGLGIAGYEFGINFGLSGNAVPINSITHVGTTATVTTSANHNLLTGYTVVMSGQTPSDYSGETVLDEFVVTVPGPTTFTYTTRTTPASNASVVGTYKNMGLVNAWANSTQCKEAYAYALQEWERVTLPNVCNANIYVEIGPWATETYTGKSIIRYVGDSVSAKGQALIDFNTNVKRYPNDLAGTISFSQSDPNGTTAATLTKFNARSTMSIQSVTGTGMNAAGFAIGDTTTSPNCLITIANNTLLSSALGAVTITVRETNALFPAPGYHDTVITGAAFPALPKSNFNNGTTLDPAIITTKDLLGRASVMTQSPITLSQASGSGHLINGPGTTNRGFSPVFSTTIDITVLTEHYAKFSNDSGTEMGLCIGCDHGVSSGHVLHALWTGSGTWVLLHRTGAGAVDNYGGSGGLTLANWPWCKIAYVGGNVKLYVAPSSASNPPAPSDWVQIGTNAWPAGMPTSGLYVGFFQVNDGGSPAGADTGIDCINMAAG
jgi:hypothetical protein